MREIHNTAELDAVVEILASSGAGFIDDPNFVDVVDSDPFAGIPVFVLDVGDVLAGGHPIST